MTTHDEIRNLLTHFIPGGPPDALVDRLEEYVNWKLSKAMDSKRKMVAGELGPVHLPAKGMKQQFWCKVFIANTDDDVAAIEHMRTSNGLVYVVHRTEAGSNYD